MKYVIEFDNGTVDEYFRDITHYFDWALSGVETKDLECNIRNAVTFCHKVDELKLFGALTNVSVLNDCNSDFHYIQFAKINNHEFVKHCEINTKELKDALWEIAHPKNEEETQNELD